MQPQPPWRDAETVLDGVRFNVVAVGYPQRSGGTKRREVVVPANAVVVLPLLDEQTVVLIRNERFAVGETLWELPAGTVEEGEDPDLCAARELKEETGYTAARVDRLIEFYTTPGFCTERMTAYRAQGLSFEGQQLDETEKIETQAVPLSQALEMVRDNRIRDGKSIATLLYHWQFGRGGS